MRTTLTLAPLALLAACQFGGDPQSYGDVLPDSRLLIEMPDMSSQARAVGERSEYAQLTLEITDDVNTSLADVLALLDTITAFDPTWSSDADDTALWGPWEDGDVDGQLWVSNRGNDAYTWALELRPAGTETWTPVLAGETEAGATSEESRGSFALDFTAIETLGAGDGITGSMAADYALFADGAAATVYFGEILDENGEIPQDAAYVFEHHDGAGGSMDVALTEDVTEDVGEGGSLELLILRSRWDDTGAGRTDGLVTGGDVGELVYTASECWDAAHGLVFFEDNYDFDTGGEASSCVFAEASYPE